MMLVSNFLFDLFYFAGFFNPQSGFPAGLARVTAGVFVLLAGVSLTLSYARPAAQRLGFRKYLQRGGGVFALGMLITLITRLVVGQEFVVFGILHLIGVGIILSYPFLRHRWLSLFCGLLITGAGFFTTKIVVVYPWLLWLGLQYQGFSSVDYTPLVPWFGLMLIGIFMGPSLASIGRSVWHGSSSEYRLPTKALVGCGRHSLLIYFVHQPIFWAGFWLWFRFVR